MWASYPSKSVWHAKERLQPSWVNGYPNWGAQICEKERKNVCMNIIHMFVSICNHIIMRLGEEITVTDSAGYVSNGACDLHGRTIIPKKCTPQNQPGPGGPLSRLTWTHFLGPGTNFTNWLPAPNLAKIPEENILFFNLKFPKYLKKIQKTKFLSYKNSPKPWSNTKCKQNVNIFSHQLGHPPINLSPPMFITRD